MIIFDYLYFKIHVFLHATNGLWKDSLDTPVIHMIIPLWMWTFFLTAYIPQKWWDYILIFFNDFTSIIFLFLIFGIYYSIGYYRYGYQEKGRKHIDKFINEPIWVAILGYIYMFVYCLSPFIFGYIFLCIDC